MSEFKSNYEEKRKPSKFDWAILGILTFIAFLILGMVIQNEKNLKYQAEIARYYTAKYEAEFQDSDAETDDYDIELKTEDSTEATKEQTEQEETEKKDTNASSRYKINDNMLAEKIATYSREFYREYAEKCKYGFSGEGRRRAYWLIPDENGQIEIDCVGMVNVIMHQGIGLSLPDGREDICHFICPEGQSQRAYASQEFEMCEYQREDVLPGDVLILKERQHQVIYVGAGEILSMEAQLQLLPVETYTYSKIVRLKSA